ncbi:hypothetical protein CJF30_00000568 [Rutstroemia sp. NJR-2017a BBW]|nr:hypothetical protein CJF30_00000568 [Rutstroemia sp. NJR-2017a BBW]
MDLPTALQSKQVFLESQLLSLHRRRSQRNSPAFPHLYRHFKPILPASISSFPNSQPEHLPGSQLSLRQPNPTSLATV